MRRASGPALALLALLALLVASFCGGPAASKPAPFRPVPPTATNADSLIREGETHFAHLYQLTFGGQNAEAYWSGDGTKLIWQWTSDTWPCDQEYVMDLRTGARTRVSTGRGRTTCGYFYDHDRRVLFASTHAGGDSCPPPPDMSHGYTWAIYPSYEIYTARPDGSDLQQLTHHPGYDAEGTMSVDGKWLVFTSKRDGDVDLYKMHMDGTGLTRLTHSIGYDGGAYFSHDGKHIVWRTYRTDDSTANATFTSLLAKDLVKPVKMDLWIMDADGSHQRRVTDQPGASFAPYFTPDDRSIIYASNWTNPRGRNFDLWLVPVGGGEPVRVTRDPDFDGFPMFSPDGHWLAFCANRGGKVPGETNVFLAEWRP
jgi:Tol biopolymer transport system component